MTPKRKPETILEAIVLCPTIPAELRAKMRNHIETFGIGQLASREDIVEAGALMSQIALHLGADSNSRHLLKMVEVAQKSINSAASAMKDFSEIDFPRQLIERFQKELHRREEVLKTVLPKELWEQYERIRGDAFEKEEDF